MEKFFSNFRSWLNIGLWFFTMLLIGGTIYASVNNIWTTPNELEVISWSNLTSENWNKILSNQNYLSWRIDWWLVMPRWWVMAFNLETCPEWWSEANWVDNALDLRGEFIRWLDKWRWLDPDNRVLASTQKDSFQGHYHNFYIWETSAEHNHLRNQNQIASAHNAGSRYLQSETTWMQDIINVAKTDWVNWIPRTSSETRPHNVALLYCVKN